ncbi:hypothetical protein [Nocardia sp. NRRL S-836]|uniref:hypothetical protein n=1 Tax=Nocardia sp. NRRL S-836 TaxID=1519492 RepID=UPI0006B04A49|nr:hypothetical protein [Nocardia sp. NRRL S-836]KOV82524.1 hypothetical protein ADL03_23625 [Nocardia sp. NRRL S-836]
MIGPDPRHQDVTHNQVHSDRLDTAFRAGQVHGDAHVGTTTVNSRTTTISLPALGVVLGAVLTLVLGLVVWKVVATAHPQASVPPIGSTVRTSPKTSAPPDSTPVREVRLTGRTGVDLDGDETAARRADGATGDTDLYLTENALLYANGSGFADDRGSEQQARARCTDAVAGGYNTPSPILPLLAGTQYCFATSDRRVAWLRVKNSDWVSSGEVVLAVLVWQP